MASINWLKRAFFYGYSSGEILSEKPNWRRRHEERKIGGSYREVYAKAAAPFLRPDARVLEFGPGRGSWTRALAASIPDGELHVVDFLDVSRWISRIGSGRPRIICHQVGGHGPYSSLPDDYFDFIWSFGVLCHNNRAQISSLLRNTLSKLRPGGLAVHHFGDWEKLDRYGWRKGGVPEAFKLKSDEEIWWPRNSARQMAGLARESGWTVLQEDLKLLGRDAIAVFSRGDR